MNSYDVIVVGGGHAGIEAAAAAGRIGAKVALLSGNLDTIGKMSCNPAIGGLAKGQVAREVDALGGLMGQITDQAGIHFRELGRSKGPAVWSPRAQCDKALYHIAAKEAVEYAPNVWPMQGVVADLLRDTHDQGKVTGVRLQDGRLISAPRVVITTGTFLRGLMHTGESKSDGGRAGDHGSQGLSSALKDCGLKLLRLKTGTPMRVHAASIDLSHCEEQAGDGQPKPFSYLNHAPKLGNKIHCLIAYTRPEAHSIIHANLDRAPMYNGQIESIGPRYCPSIEDKVVRFADREQHQLFLEPEGINSQEVYVNGLSTSLPVDVQDAVLQAIPALSKAHIMRYGYAVEYDAVSPDQIDHCYQVITVPGLYLAGQINGTSGYEEAAIQGLLAGANAALSLANKDPLVLSRADGYGGVLTDDLIACVPEEPYRLFTSRAEHRLLLRADNADRRLTPIALKAGLIDQQRASVLASKQDAVTQSLAAVSSQLESRIAGEAWSLAQTIEAIPSMAELDRQTQETIWVDLRYGHYLARQQQQIERMQRQRDVVLPSIDYQQLTNLSNEARAALTLKRPPTLGAAAMIAGVSQSDAEQLWAWLQAYHRGDEKAHAGILDNERAGASPSSSE